MTPLMQVSADNAKWSHTLDECLKKGSMRKGPLVLKTSEMDLMPQKMRDIDLPFGRRIEAMHEIDAVAIARPLVTHLGINGADDTLKDNVERRAPNGDLVQTLLFLSLVISSMGLRRSAQTSMPLGLWLGSSLWILKPESGKPREQQIENKRS